MTDKINCAFLGSLTIGDRAIRGGIFFEPFMMLGEPRMSNVRFLPDKGEPSDIPEAWSHGSFSFETEHTTGTIRAMWKKEYGVIIGADNPASFSISL